MYSGPTTTLRTCGIIANTAGWFPITSPSMVNSRLLGLASTQISFARAKKTPFFAQVVRVGQNRGGELEYLQYSDVFYDHEVKEPILGVGPRCREPTASGVTALADRQADRAKFSLGAVQHASSTHPGQ
jgi:hypothetical protein